MPADVIEEAVAEARRRQALSDRAEGSDDVAHFAAVVRSICADWRLTATHWLDGGIGNPPLAVTAPSGAAAVLKICRPGSADDAWRVLTAARGRGYVRVLATDPDRGALLTERLGADLWTAAPTLLEQSEVIVPLLRDAWRVPTDRGHPFEGKASGLARILTELGPRYGSAHPRAVELAARYARELADTERPEVVCHGDPHPGNVLRRGDGWALIDPDGFVGERAYDLGVVLRDGCREFTAAEARQSGAGTRLLRRASRRLAELAGADPERVWRWGFVERVTTGLYLRWFGHADESDTFLRTATSVATAHRES